MTLQNKALQNKAMLVTMSVSCWTAQKKDTKVSAEIEASHNAKNAGRYNKMLVDKAHLDPLTSFAGAVRSYHYKMTLPWLDNGARLLPSKLFMEYSAEIRKLQSDYRALVDKFVNHYDAHLIQDARQRLGTMYDPDDYPPGHKLRDKFGIEIDIAPVPDGQDFRVDVTESERNRIASEITGKVAERQAAAQRDAWVRVREVVSLIEARCSAEKTCIRESLIDNARDLSRLLPGLNVAAEPLMDDVCGKIVEHLLVDPERLRKSVTTRKRVAASAREILEMLP